MDRFTGTAVLDRSHAAELGVLGVAGRASGLDFDARLAHPFLPICRNFVPPCTPSGDVLARFQVRVEEVDVPVVALRLRPEADPLQDRDAQHSAQRAAAARRRRASSRAGVAPSCTGSRSTRSGRLTRVKVVDPSFFNWPALPVSLADTIVPDFPLANKSFNLSYAGNDL